MEYLRQVPSPCQWLDLTGLIVQAETLLAELQQLGAEQMPELDQGMLLKIQTTS